MATSLGNYPNCLDDSEARRSRGAVFVFGSNLEGVHGKGAARYARDYLGAVTGCGEGPTGQSYALPTKRAPYVDMELQEVEESVGRFLDYARANSETLFKVTRVGCNNAGFTDDLIAPLFDSAPDNCLLPGLWLRRRRPDLVRLIIAGSRGAADMEWACTAIDQMTANLQGDVEVVCGGARGADKAGAEWATRQGIRVHGFPAEWDSYRTKVAGIIRNAEMAWFGTHLLAIRVGHTPGTANMIETAKRDGLVVRAIAYLGAVGAGPEVARDEAGMQEPATEHNAEAMSALPLDFGIG